MNLITTSHAADDMPATKSIHNIYAAVVNCHLDTLQALNELQALSEERDLTPAESKTRSERLQVLGATGRFLENECGWSKWDVRTSWTIE